MQQSGLFRRLDSILRREDYAPSMVYSAPSISYSHEYPDVPPPEDDSSLNLIALRWAVGDLHAEEMAGIAADLLESGQDSPSLRRLAGEMHLATWADAEPLVSRVFTELGVSYPIVERQAKLLLTRQIAREVISGKRSAWTAASHIEIVVCGWVAEIAELEPLFLLNDQLNWDERHRPSIPTLTRELVELMAVLAVMPLEARVAG